MNNYGLIEEQDERENCMSGIARRTLLPYIMKRFSKKTQNRIVALKVLQIEQFKIEEQFYLEVFNLEKKYHKKRQSLLDRRCEIISGLVEPPNQEPKYKDPRGCYEIISEMRNQLKINNLTPICDERVKGIPNFWLTIFRNMEVLSRMVYDCDEPLLAKLRDVKLKYEESEEPSYTLEFHFDKNDYFSNKVLTKQYFLKVNVDREFPFSYDGPAAYKCKGCSIKWAKSMDLTTKIVCKKQRCRASGAVKTITHQIPNNTFFNFFTTSEYSGDNGDIDEDSQDLLTWDFQIGHYLRTRIIPKAVLCYTGELNEDNEYSMDYDEDGSDEFGEDLSDDDQEMEDGNDT